MMHTAARRRATSGWRTFFLIAAVYDLVLGAVFFSLYGPIFSWLGVDLPNNISYIHLTAAFVFVQGVGYWLVWRDPVANIGIVTLGIAYKGAYSILALYYLVSGDLIHAVFAWFGLFDFAFLVGFVWFLLQAHQPENAEEPGGMAR
jgi:hypothetical protein